MNILSFIIIICEILLLFYFTIFLTNTKKKDNFTILFAIFFSAFFYFLFTQFFNLLPNFLTNQIFPFFLSFVILTVYKFDFLTSLTITELYSFITILIKLIISYIFPTMPSSQPLFVSIICVCLFFLIMFLLKDTHINKIQIPFSNYTISLIIILCVEISSVFYKNKINSSYFLKNEYLSLSIFFIILCVLVYFIILSNQKISKENSTLKYANEHLFSSNTIDFDYELRKLKHSLKNQLITIEYLLEDGQYKEAQQLIKKNINNPALKKVIQTKNNTLNMLLNYYIQMYEDIKFTSIIKIDTFPIDSYSLIIILGNILDNAIEAVTPLIDNKSIFIQIIETNSTMHIEIENQYTHTIQYENGFLKTNKMDTSFHGIGLAQVKEHVEKYNGLLNIDINEEEKTFKISIQLQK